MKYVAKRGEPLTPEQMAVYKEFGFSEKLSRLLFIRGVVTKQQITDFSCNSPNRLHDPFLLKGMKEAVDRIDTAISKKERILIIGDYDCDGICSTAIMYKYLISRRANIRYFLPNRDSDGYGLTIELIKTLYDKFNPALIITVDCGISCHAEIEYAKSLGIECIVTDHHAIPELVPDCICVNPKFLDQEYPFKELCGAGVALKLVQALSSSQSTPEDGIKEALRYVDICALATVSDIVSLHDENRVIVSLGLENLNAGSNPAITALAKSCNVYGALKSTDISYKLGPKINASGRMGNAKRGLDLLLEKDPKKIEEIIESLTSLNSARQKLCFNITQEAEQIIEEQNLSQNNIIVVYKDNWEGGVLGTVSARIVDRYGKPAIVMSKSDSVYKGSARSVGSLNMVATLEKFSDYLATFGGHYMAAGLSVSVDQFDDFVSALVAHANSLDIGDNVETNYDFDLDIGEITIDMIKEFEKLEPLGCDNPIPTFMGKIGSVRTSILSSTPRHLRFSTESGASFIFFDGTIHNELLQHSCEKKILFEFQKLDTSISEEYQKQPAIKGIVKAVVPVLHDAMDEKSIAINLFGDLVGTLYVQPEHLEKVKEQLVIDRDVFVEYYKLIRRYNSFRVLGIYDFYTKIKSRASIENFDLYQFVFCCAVFMQLGILNFENNQVKINEGVSTELTKSQIYKKICNLAEGKPTA